MEATIHSANSVPKSALTAGVLGIFLGVFGAHDWYLNNQKKAKLHVALALLGGALFAISTILFTLTSSANSPSLTNLLGNIAATLNTIAWLTIVADAIWGIIEGILLLAQGDAGLAAQGYAVKPATPPAPEESNIGYNSVSMIQSSAAAPQAAATISPAPTASSQSSSLVSTSQPAAPGQPATPLSAPASSAVDQPKTAVSQPSASSSLTFRSSDIKPAPSMNAPAQPIGSKDVELPPMMVANQQGKATVNPVLIRRFSIGAVIVVAVIVVFFIVKGGIDAVVADGYGATYRAAKELLPQLTTAHQSSSCEYAIDYVNASYVDRRTYDGYIDTCKNLATGVNFLVNQLGETPAIQWNSQLKDSYETFKALYYEAFPDSTDLVDALPLYQSWHNYVLAVDQLTVDSADVEFQEAADILRQSGNPTLAQYGEDWLSKELDYIQAYRLYWDTSYTDPEKESLREAADTKRTDLRNWVADHRPDVTALASFTVPDTTPMYNSYTKLYDLIKTSYEEHYDADSGDCTIVRDEAYCQ